MPYRIITAGVASVSRGRIAAAGFNSPRRLHATPRRYTKLDSAVKRALKFPGQHDIVDDNRNIVAVINNKILVGVIPECEKLVSFTAGRQA